MRKEFNDEIVTEMIPVYITLEDEERDEIASCKTDIPVSLIKVDDSFEWENGYHEDSHWEYANEEDIQEEILKAFYYNYDSSLLKLIVKELVEKIATDWLEKNSLGDITYEVNLISFVTEGALQ